MSDTERITYQDRLREFPEQIRETAKHNTAVRAIMELYARSQILTIEYALIRMVISLHEREENTRREFVDMQNSTHGIVVPKDWILIN